MEGDINSVYIIQCYKEELCEIHWILCFVLLSYRNLQLPVTVSIQ